MWLLTAGIMQMYPSSIVSQACCYLFSLLQGSIISSPHTRRRATTPREDAPRGPPPMPNSASTSILGSLFGSKRGKPSSQSHPPLPPPGHPTLISHKPHPTNLHHTAQTQHHPHHSQYCQVPQNPPPYHHHHHYHPPPHTQYHQHPGYGSHSHQHPHSQQPHYSQHPHHSSHSHHHSQQSGSVPSGPKPKHSGISTVVWCSGQKQGPQWRNRLHQRDWQHDSMACPLCFGAAVTGTNHTQSPLSPLCPTTICRMEIGLKSSTRGLH